jgi:hypothetical protein
MVYIMWCVIPVREYIFMVNPRPTATLRHSDCVYGTGGRITNETHGQDLFLTMATLSFRVVVCCSARSSDCNGTCQMSMCTCTAGEQASRLTVYRGQTDGRTEAKLDKYHIVHEPERLLLPSGRANSTIYFLKPECLYFMKMPGGLSDRNYVAMATDPYIL